MAVIFNDEQRKLIFEILPVDRIQDNEDPWWNVHIAFHRFCVSYDDVRESLTESEIKETILMMDKYLERIEKHDFTTYDTLDYMEPEIGFVFNHSIVQLVIKIGYADTIQVCLEKNGLVKIKEELERRNTSIKKN